MSTEVPSTATTMSVSPSRTFAAAASGSSLSVTVNDSMLDSPSSIARYSGSARSPCSSISTSGASSKPNRPNTIANRIGKTSAQNSACRSR